MDVCMTVSIFEGKSQSVIETGLKVLALFDKRDELAEQGILRHYFAADAALWAIATLVQTLV